jgi:hypothetical protein
MHKAHSTSIHANTPREERKSLTTAGDRVGVVDVTRTAYSTCHCHLSAGGAVVVSSRTQPKGEVGREKGEGRRGRARIKGLIGLDVKV